MKKSIALKMLTGVITTGLTVTGIAVPATIRSHQNTAKASVMAEEDIQVASAAMDARSALVGMNIPEKADAAREDRVNPEAPVTDRQSMEAASDGQRFMAGQQSADSQKSMTGQKPVDGQKSNDSQKPVGDQKSADVQKSAGAQKSADVQEPVGAQKSAGGQKPADNQTSVAGQKPDDAQNTDNVAAASAPQKTPVIPDNDKSSSGTSSSDGFIIITGSTTGSVSSDGFVVTPRPKPEEPKTEEVEEPKPEEVEEPVYIRHNCNCGWSTTDYEELKMHMYNHAINGEAYSYSTHVGNIQ